ncbi:peptide chain release factor 1 [Candidatus Allofournierella merdipullorum]|uniref:peptide chain release factor 1 n=1 Tax=Candidatus Allofournierella merdipullorum TaxID=2838595 RepID=UPI003AB73BBB
MLEQLRRVRRRYDEVNLSLQDPAILADGGRYAALMKEYKRLTPLMEALDEYERVCAGCAEARALLDEGGLEPDFREMVQTEYSEGRQKQEELEQTLRILLLPRDENDDRNVILEIRSGAGGEEAALFAASLWRMYSMYAAAKGWKCEVLNLNKTELGGVKEISVSVQGEGAYSRLKYESGVHRVQRVPETETQGRIHTSTVTVAVMPEAEEVDVQLDPADLKFDTFRSSGAGGQHVNKTSSAIRVTHLPTGMVVECQDERSQYKNKDKALKVLRSRLLAEKQQAQKDAIDADRRSQVGTGDRSERIRTYNFPQGRVTDHRIGLTLYKLDSVMDGALDEVLNALITADQTRRLQAAQEKEATL